MELGPRGLRAFWMQAPMLAVHFSGACGKTIAPAELLNNISMNSDSVMGQHQKRINLTLTSQHVNSVSKLCLILGELPQDGNLGVTCLISLKT